ncbi:MAG: endonuclease MutS2 [Candidatus Delongbacteria bacterium]|nr:endonuclease MutS2 [Candidatus Delongbacteria bacterium]MBN2835550.1 endonuclease MutS2 [Candidatus Delongbacteria bacterium]
MKAAEILGLPRVLEEVSKSALTSRGKWAINNLDLTENIDVVRSDLDLVDAMKRVITSEHELPFDQCPDITENLKALRSVDQFMDPIIIWGFGVVLRQASSIYSFFYSRKEIFPDLYEIAQELEPFEDVEEMIFRSVDHEGNVLDTASSELKSIRNRIKITENRIRDKVKHVFDSYKYAGYCQSEELTIRDGRFVIPVKAENRNKVKGVVRDESATGNTLFVEPLESIEMNGELGRLYKEEKREVDRIIRAITTELYPLKEELEINMDIITEFDVFYAKARYSLKYRCSKVHVNTDNIVNIYDGYHPILLIRHGYESTVPLNLEIGEKSNTLVISGPNAGGKTVTMKTTGLFCLMIRAGLHIPARDNSNIAIFRKIFADIGDEQSIDNDLSTFSSHIRKLSMTLKAKEKDTLILLDEIGASTDPAEGSALSMSILREYTKRGYITIATTHQGVLKTFAHKTKGVTNGSMEFDRANLSPTYRFRGGIPGSSYAFDISRRHGLPNYIIERAKKMLGDEKKSMEELILELDSQLTKYSTLVRENESLKQEATKLKDEYEKKYNEIKTNEKVILREAAKQGKEIINQANRSIENAIYEIKKNNADKETIKDVRKTIIEETTKLANNIEKMAPKEKKELALKPAKGLEVKLKNIGEWGVINSVESNGKRMSVSVGGLVLNINTKDIVDLRAPEVEKESVNVNFSSTAKAPFMGIRLDVRGKRGDDALMIVERYVDNLKQHNISKAEIVHGKGEGILGRLIQEQLRRTPGVKDVRFGNPGEGDYGVTLLELE